MPSLEGNFLTQNGTKFAHMKLETTLSYDENPESLISPGLVSVSGRDWQTDGQTELR